jgi:TolA-binding protein
MILRSWQILALSICLTSGLQGQEVRRALPITPTPAPAPRAQPVHPDQIPSSQSILDEKIPLPQSAQPRKTPENNSDAKTSTGSAAEPDSKVRDQATDDEIRLAPNQGQDTQAADPAKNQLAIADGMYIRKLYDLAVPEYEKYLGQFPNDSARASAMYRLADCY